MSDNIASEISSGSSSEYFSTSWAAYKKILENNYMGHAEAYEVLRQIISNEVRKPFRFLDLACGDACYSSRALRDTDVALYAGIDLSEAALQAAAQELTRLGCGKELKKGDLNEFDSLVEPPFDVVWIGLSLHHLDTVAKAGFMKRVHDALSEDGVFLIYEPVYIEGENKEAYFDRIKGIIENTWTGLSQEEAETLLEHVKTTEIPETMSTWTGLGNDAGFKTAEKIFSEPTGLYSIFMFRK